MTTDFRALCAELVNRFDELYGRICDDDTIIYVDSEVNELMNYARAALAEAVPEGREPASVTEQPTVMQLIELSYEIEAAGLGQVDFARAVLARWGTPNLAETRSSLGDAPQPPADGEMAELTGKLVEAANGAAAMGWDQHAQHILRAAELLQRQYPQPVPVSERLSGPEEMTEDSEVWIEDPGHNYPLADSGDYDWEPHKWVLRPIGKFDAKSGLRWLPAHALPLPTTSD